MLSLAKKREIRTQSAADEHSIALVAAASPARINTSHSARPFLATIRRTAHPHRPDCIPFVFSFRISHTPIRVPFSLFRGDVGLAPSPRARSGARCAIRRSRVHGQQHEPRCPPGSPTVRRAGLHPLPLCWAGISPDRAAQVYRRGPGDLDRGVSDRGGAGHAVGQGPQHLCRAGEWRGVGSDQVAESPGGFTGEVVGNCRGWGDEE